MNVVTVDVRMLESSGIGTYIKQLLPRVIEDRPNVRFNLLGQEAELGKYEWTRRANVRTVQASSGPYSIAEQFELISLSPRDTTLFWSPHYNIPLLVGSKLLVTVHDVFHLAMPEFVAGVHRRAYARFMFAAAVRKADRILTVSRFTKQELLRLTRADPRKIRVTPLGVDRSWFEVPSEPPPHPRPYLLYAGNVKPHKNLVALLTAFGSLLTEFPHDLIIVGKRDGFITGDSAVAQSAAALGDRVTFTGYVADESLRQYFLHADALVQPSLYEGFGLPPLEAMACGTPVLASRAASLPEVCGDAATYFDPSDVEDIAMSIRRLLRDEKLAASLTERGRERARGFSWEQTTVDTTRAIDELLAPAGTAP